VAEIAVRVQVLRDGSTALLADVEGVSRRDMIEAMIGRRVADISRPAAPRHEIGSEPILRWLGASAERAFDDVSLEVRPGEVVAVYGKLGSGASEVAETAYGLRRLNSGRLELDGELVALASPVSAIRRGIGFLPAERKAGGALMVRPVAENVAIASWPLLARAGIINDAVEATAYRRWHERLSIRSRNDPRQVMATLSGGNQQKVLLSRWLERQSRVLVLIEPTRGVDVGARGDIYSALRELAATSMAILVVTSDYEEVVQVADRAYVMAKGRLVDELHGDEVTTTRLLEAAGG